MPHAAEDLPFAPGDAARDEAQLRRFLHGMPPIDDGDMQAEVAALTSEVPVPDGELIDTVIGMLDLTSLAATDTESSVRDLCGRARQPDPRAHGVPPVAAVCVYPDLVAAAATSLAGSGIGVASVAGGFPSGRTPLPVKLAEVEHAVSAGATEIDAVLDRGAFLEERYGTVFDGVAEVKRACGHATLKVILETGELVTAEQVRRASWLALLAGADILKTSTGKISPAASLPAMYLLADAVRGWHESTGERRGLKPAGGIRTTDDALRYLTLVRGTAGPRWSTPTLFRIGASGLLDDLLARRREQNS
ncbi:deoxyribose-phosphate aldolase [Haloechinothrix alba]|uniref:Deoxyribose-phosphate aldolase n=1 Tax=Haloechinothrix alba TaxID=664784 RepID=A0A238VV31_9PSEU|nr:deoxyribose-phosphate aldolase [Haloechinothrix alba]SNR38192.1 deoxyribose-phosphate aldolase [Haloechinothrix alba]